ncbi:MAG: kynureninase [Chitinophagaceae bacterium]
MQFENSLSFAQQFDQSDPLKEFRNRFIIPTHKGRQQIYFLGNSLGLQPKTTEKELGKILDQWGTYGVEGFFMGDEPWMDYHDQLTESLATITGALPSEITVMNQLTVNLHLMMISFYQPTGKRNKILCEAKAFPSDQYMFETHIRHYGLNPDEIVIEVKPRAGEHTLRTEDILKAIDDHKDELALVLFSGLNYYSGQVFDMKAITKAAHKAGAKAGFDLAHAAGNIRLELHDWNVDFACWCTYKYLNSGPGAVGGAYIHERFHTDKNIPRYAGWWGYDKSTRFKMQKGFNPIHSAEGWQLSTPSLLLYAAHKAALDTVEAAGWDHIQTKAKKLTSYLWWLLDDVQSSLPGKKIEVLTPRDENERGCQVSMLMLENGRAVFEKLTAAGIITDWREPDLIRFAPVALYNTFEEVWHFANTLRQILKN